MDIINAAGMDETYGTYVDDACFDIHDHDDDSDHDTNDGNTNDDTNDDADDDATNDDTDDDTDDGGRGNLYIFKVPGGKLVYLSWALVLNL